MYCVNCGVELADSEKKCPLCGTAVYHPDLKQQPAPSPYPPYTPPGERMKPAGILFVLTVLCSLPFVLTLLCDWSINHGITWSGYAAGAVLLFYILALLPMWFKKPNPVIFTPVDFAAIALYLLYINLQTGGHWFLTFAFPVTGGIGLIVTAVVTMLHYLRRGHLYVFGGAMIASGGFAVLMEFLLNLTFGFQHGFIWSIYPLAALFLLGMMLIVIAICKPLRESLRKIFFL